VSTSNDKGLIAEIEIRLAAVRAGVPVLAPMEHARYDLAFDVGGRIWRVQCKWGRLGPRRDVVVVSSGSFRLSSAGCVRTTYGEDEVDLFAVYCGEIDRCFLLPIAVVGGRSQIQLRLTAPRNSQRACINLAEDFAFDGAIAQLGERCHGMAEVVGSSPTSSTSTDGPAAVGPEGPATAGADGPVVVGANQFRDEFGSWMDRVAGGEEVLVTRHGRPRIRLSPAIQPGAAV
jgi:prevent-host-death family protein